MFTAHQQTSEKMHFQLCYGVGSNAPITSYIFLRKIHVVLCNVDLKHETKSTAITGVHTKFLIDTAQIDEVQSSFR